MEKINQIFIGAAAVVAAKTMERMVHAAGV